MGARWSSGLAREGGGAPDPVTGLTPAQVEAVRRTFATIRGDPKGLGVDLFLSLFEAHPEYQKLFRAFASVPRSELPSNKRFAAHASTVVYSIMGVIDNLDDAECLIELLLRIGQSHGRRHIQTEAFENLKVVVMGLLRSKLKSRLTPFAEDSWSKTLDVANSVIFKGIEEGKKEAPKNSIGTKHD